MRRKIKSSWIDNRELIISGGLVRTANIAPECYEDINDVETLVQGVRKAKVKADILTFGQRLPEIKPKFNYFMEWTSIAAISIKSYEYWLEKQIDKYTRKNVKRAKKKGVITKEVSFDDDFVKGILKIYNETPVRQGKPFWHYKKDFDTIKKEHSTYLDKSVFIGAYFKNELIGFIVMFYSEKCANTMQVISRIDHRDKKPTNALIAKAVEICDKRRIQYLQYGAWSGGTLGDFKRHNGFEKISMPQYYIPLNYIGNLALKLQLNHGIFNMLPHKIKNFMIGLKSKWYSRKYLNIQL